MSEELFQIKAGVSGDLARERDRILSLLRATLPAAVIAEVGSTAVEGVIGKQDVDIAIVLPLREFSRARFLLDQMFRRNMGQLSSDCYQGYLASPDFDVALQLTVKGCPHDTFDAFLDVLRSDPQLIDAYNQLKRDWCGKPMGGYGKAKARFITQALRNC